jgi:glycerol-3-phosphate acyltransferase PlsY
MSTVLIFGVLIPYLLGSIPFGYILVRIFRGEDVRRVGSGNIGATNVARKSPALGLSTLGLDALKGFAAVMLASTVAHSALNRFRADTLGGYVNPYYIDPHIIMALAALMAILGHMFPIWLKFKGGKGVATGVGSFLALAPKAVVIVLVIFVAVVALSRYVSLGSIAATAAFPAMVWLLYRYEAGPLVMTAVLAAAVLIIYKHKENIRRLLAGTENRLELKRGAKA